MIIHVHIFKYLLRDFKNVENRFSFNINCEHYLYPTLYNLDSKKKCNQNLKKKYLVKKQKLKCRYQI